MDCFAFGLWTKGCHYVTNFALFKSECCTFGLAMGGCFALIITNIMLNVLQ